MDYAQPLSVLMVFPASIIYWDNLNVVHISNFYHCDVCMKTDLEDLFTSRTRFSHIKE